jgi:hypothetical protein
MAMYESELDIFPYRFSMGHGEAVNILTNSFKKHFGIPPETILGKDEYTREETTSLYFQEDDHVHAHFKVYGKPNPYKILMRNCPDYSETMKTIWSELAMASIYNYNQMTAQLWQQQTQPWPQIQPWPQQTQSWQQWQWRQMQQARRFPIR